MVGSEGLSSIEERLSGSTERERERVDRRVGGCSEEVAAATPLLRGEERVDMEGDEACEDDWEGCDAAAPVVALAASKNGEALRRRAPLIGWTRILEGLSPSLLGELCRPVLVVGMLAEVRSWKATEVAIFCWATTGGKMKEVKLNETSAKRVGETWGIHSSSRPLAVPHKLSSTRPSCCSATQK